MQEYTRCHLCKFHFHGTPESYEKYCDEKAYIEKIASLINTKAQLYDFKSTQRVVGFCLYNREKYIFLTGCIYKQHLFFGFFLGKEKGISFSCDEQINHKPFDKLEANMVSRMNRITRGERSPKSPAFAEIEAAWDECEPLLDAIINYETSISLMPQVKREALYRSGRYYTNIENIVSAFEAEHMGFLSRNKSTVERD